MDNPPLSRTRTRHSLTTPCFTFFLTQEMLGGAAPAEDGAAKKEDESAKKEDES
jgi:hypothetical protein